MDVATPADGNVLAWVVAPVVAVTHVLVSVVNVPPSWSVLCTALVQPGQDVHVIAMPEAVLENPETPIGWMLTVTTADVDSVPFCSSIALPARVCPPASPVTSQRKVYGDIVSVEWYAPST